MTLEQLLPELSSLSRVEKFKALQCLVEELAADETLALIEPYRDYEVWSPDRADEAAETLLNLLRTSEPHDAGI